MDTSGPHHRNKAGFVYFLATENFEYVKVGCTTNLDKRTKQLAIQLPFKVSLLHSLETDDMHWLERLIHDYFHDYRVNGEWFRLGASGADQIRDVFSPYMQYDIWDRQDQVDLENETWTRLGWPQTAHPEWRYGR